MEAEKLIPVKRNEALIKFSKEHHYGLLLGWEIRQGLENNTDIKRIADYVLFFFDNDLESHFAEEEKILFSKLCDDDVLKQQAIHEHRSMYAIIKNIRAGKYGKETLETFANELESHIRFEERVLFNHIQEKLSEDELLDVLLKHTHKTVDVDGDWDDRFWEG